MIVEHKITDPILVFENIRVNTRNGAIAFSGTKRSDANQNSLSAI